MKESKSTPPAEHRKPGRRRVMETAGTYTALEPRARIARAIDLLGNGVVAQIMDVSASQPGRWASGQERISQGNLARVIHLDCAVGRIMLSLAPGAIPGWLQGQNPFLGVGASRPIDVMILRGPLAILPALDALDAGAYA